MSRWARPKASAVSASVADTASLNSVPAVPDRRVAVRPTAAGLAAVRRGDPWLFDGSITSAQPDDLPPGAIAIVFDDRRRVAGVGLWDPTSPIRVRMLHAGGACEIGPAFFVDRLRAALSRRDSLVGATDTTAWRWVHGENDALPALVVDRYNDTVVVKIYSAAWLPHLPSLVHTIGEVAPFGVSRVVLRTARGVRAAADAAGLGDGVTVMGEAPVAPVGFLERGLRLEADVVRGHKTGHFLDQRDNRALVRSMSAGRHVLDVFSATGGFSLAAAAGGATSVTMVDQSRPALDTARANIALNTGLGEVAACEVSDLCGDAFDILERLAADGRTWDVVVLDPPSFAPNAASRPRALRAYRRLAAAGLAITAPGGMLVQASCSARVDVDELAGCVQSAARSVGRRAREIRRTGHPVDHPIGFDRGAYLKALYVSVAASGTKN